MTSVFQSDMFILSDYFIFLLLVKGLQVEVFCDGHLVPFLT